MAESETTRDLIAPWVDAPVVPWEKYPAWFQWVAMDESGSWWGYDTNPKLCATSWRNNDGWATQIHPKYLPTFTGSWRDSLVMRPEGGTK